MRLACLLIACAVQVGCESIPLYEGDRDPFSMIDVIEPIDISPMIAAESPAIGTKVPAPPSVAVTTPPVPRSPCPNTRATPNVSLSPPATPLAPKAPYSEPTGNDST